MNQQAKGPESSTGEARHVNVGFRGKIYRVTIDHVPSVSGAAK